MASQLFLAMPSRKQEPAMESLTTAQSMALVQIFVNASLACICYSRELLPYYSNCFQSRFLSDLESWKSKYSSYQAFARLDVQLQPATSQEFKLLVRGESVAGSQILDLVENGLFDALDQGYLEAVQFFVTPDVGDPTAVYESYSFSFTYGNGGQQVTGVELSSSGQHVVVDAFKSFKRAIKSLLQNLQDLPRLPRQKSLGMSLTYKDSCPLEYQPQGFHDATPPSSQNNAMDWSILWGQSKGTLGEFDTGFHRVKMGSSHIRTLLPTNAATESQEQDVHFGKQLEAMQKTSSQPTNFVSTVSQRNRDHGPQKTSSLPGKSAPASSDAGRVQTPDKGRASHERIIREETQSTDRLMASSATRANCSTPLQRSTQSSGAVTYGRSKKAVPATSARLKNRRQRNINPEKMAELVVHACAVENHSKGNYIFNPEELKNNKVVRMVPGSEVRCECQSTNRTDKMLFCNLCGTSQHMECYGFGEIRPKKLPEEHFCYACLLLPKEEILNRQMPTRVRTRLALEYLYSQSGSCVHVNARFADALHLGIDHPQDRQRFEATVDSLLQEGFVIKTENLTLKVVNIRKADAQINYLDHLASIWEHYEAAKDNEGTEKRYDVIQAAVDEYAAGRSYAVGEIDPAYDEVIVRDAFGQLVIRWGYYDDCETDPRMVVARDLKRKAGSEVVSSPKRARGRKLSIGDFVNTDRCTPSTDRSMDETDDPAAAGEGGSVGNSEWK